MMESSNDSVGAEPAGRRGVSTVVHKGMLYQVGGYPSSAPSEIDVYDFGQSRWKVTDHVGNRSLRTAGSCSVVLKDSMYMFGGWCDGTRSADLVKLNFDDLIWSILDVDNPEVGPMWKDKAGMVDYGEDMLCVFGGYGWPPHWPHSLLQQYRLQKGASYHWDIEQEMAIGWTNELHVYHIPTGQWVSPELSGARPPPCAAFSFTRVDRHRVLLFGGRQQEERVDHLYILDMFNWHWSGPVVPSGPWPTKRSFHTACALVDPSTISCHHFHHPPLPGMVPSSGVHPEKLHPWLPCRSPPDLCAAGEDAGDEVDPKLLVLWGMDNEGDPVPDCWLLNVTTLTWEKLILPDKIGPPRIWANVGVFYPCPHEAVILLGGGAQTNLFKRAENLIDNVHRSSLLHFGLSRSLYHLCLVVVGKKLSEFGSLIQHLPKPIQNELQLVVEQEHNKEKHFVYHCSF